ncbi:MAG: hypothetical protein N2320_06520, partial [Candidatus Bipolaricaulota bacterium]|nr:hypothetical protein [Candidatus Bipolaricaulota bacterium]
MGDKILKAGRKGLAVLLVLVVGALGLVDGVAYGTAQAGAGKSIPTIDIDRVLRELRKIPVGDLKGFIGKYGLWEIDPEELYMEDILNGLLYLVIKQMGLEKYLKYIKFSEESGLITVEGEFGKKLWEILGIDPEEDGGVLVEHEELRDLGFGKRDCYLLMINCRDISLELADGFMGYDWGVSELLLRQHNENYRTADGIPYTEEKELFIHQVE